MRRYRGARRLLDDDGGYSGESETDNQRKDDSKGWMADANKAKKMWSGGCFFGSFGLVIIIAAHFSLLKVLKIIAPGTEKMPELAFPKWEISSWQMGWSAVALSSTNSVAYLSDAPDARNTVIISMFTLFVIQVPYIIFHVWWIYKNTSGVTNPANSYPATCPDPSSFPANPNPLRVSTSNAHSGCSQTLSMWQCLLDYGCCHCLLP